MLNHLFRAAVHPIQCTRGRLLHAVSFALVAAMAMHAATAGERAIKSRVQPVYPEIAKRLKIVGIVVMQASVDADGKVADVKALSGNSMLSAAAEDAVRKWRFIPAPEKTTESVTINFVLAQ